MRIQTIQHLSIEEITDVFNLAFSDYAINVEYTPASKAQRKNKSRIDMSLSVGVFDKERLVAFIFAGTGQWHGHKNIYNAGTGVIPDYRGQRLVRQMYDFALPIWKKAGFTDTSLEVLVDNTFAIKAYQSVGLEIMDRLIAYHGALLKKVLPDGIIIVKKGHPNWGSYAPLHAFEYSWDFCTDGVMAVLDTIQTYELVDNKGYLLGFALVSNNGQIAQAGVKTPDDWPLLLNALGTIYDNLKWINIQEKQSDLITALESYGWTKLVEQFEMRGRI